jgi:Domain of unknown function (DUF3806)
MGEPKTESPSPDDLERLARQRAICESHLGDDETSRASYQTVAGKLELLRALLEKKTFGPEQTYELQCLGVVLGDAFVQDKGFDWIMVEDEFGRDPAIALPGTSIILYPLTVISKRIERGEVVDVLELFNRIAADVDRMRTSTEPAT